MSPHTDHVAQATIEAALQAVEELYVCPWCGTDNRDAALRGEGPHRSWCVRFRTAPGPDIAI